MIYSGKNEFISANNILLAYRLMHFHKEQLIFARNYQLM